VTGRQHQLRVHLAHIGRPARQASRLLRVTVLVCWETTYTYRPSDAVAGRASHGDDARAGRSPWHGGLGEVLPGTLGLRVVQFLPIRPHRRTRLLRPGSTVSAVADQRGGLAQSSWARRLARVAGHRPQPPGSRVVSPRGLTTSTSFFFEVVRFEPLGYQHAARTAPHLFQARRVLVVRSERGREARLPVSAGRIHDAARERRIPWSVTPDWSSGCPDPRRSKGHNLLLHPLGAIPPRWPQPRIAGQSTSTRTDYMPPASALLSRGWQAAS